MRSMAYTSGVKLLALICLCMWIYLVPNMFGSDLQMWLILGFLGLFACLAFGLTVEAFGTNILFDDNKLISKSVFGKKEGQWSELDTVEYDAIPQTYSFSFVGGKKISVNVNLVGMKHFEDFIRATLPAQKIANIQQYIGKHL